MGDDEDEDEEDDDICAGITLLGCCVHLFASLLSNFIFFVVVVMYYWQQQSICPFTKKKEHREMTVYLPYNPLCQVDATVPEVPYLLVLITLVFRSVRIASHTNYPV